MDGLPVLEDTGLENSSIHPGKMHACGHDGHMAILLALAGEVNKMKDTLKYNVLLIFQPAEETIGGAKDICQSNILSKYRVKEIFGIHLWPMLKKNTIGSRPYEFMAKSCEIDVTILGKNAHCANSEEGIDALLIGSKFLIDLYHMVENELPEKELRLLKFGKMTSGTVRNSISAITELQGTLRCFDLKIFDFMVNRIIEISSDYEKKYLCKINVSYSDGYPPVINDPNLFIKVKDILKDFNFKTFEKPFMQSEDFSFYQQEIPGVFLFLGTGTNIPLHNSSFDFDEEVLATGLKVYLKLLELD